MRNQREVFSQIYDQYVEKIYRFIILKVSSQQIAEDLTSEVFIRCWEKFKEDQNKIKNTQAFLYQISRNLVVDHYREKGRTQFVSTDYVPIVDPRPTLEENSLANSDLDTIKAALTNLKENYQEMIIWHYIEDLSVSEIAKMANKSEGSVRVIIHRALKSLKNQIKEN